MSYRDALKAIATLTVPAWHEGGPDTEAGANEWLVNRMRELAKSALAGDDECMHDEHENGICNDCGEEVDWVSRTFQEDKER